MAGAECERIRRHAQEYLDEEIDAPVLELMLVHIKLCKPCGRLLVFEAAFHRTIARGQSQAARSAHLQERCEAIMAQWRRTQS